MLSFSLQNVSLTSRACGIFCYSQNLSIWEFHSYFRYFKMANLQLPLNQDHEGKRINHLQYIFQIINFFQGWEKCLSFSGILSFPIFKDSKRHFPTFNVYEFGGDKGAQLCVFFFTSAGTMRGQRVDELLLLSLLLL